MTRLLLTVLLFTLTLNSKDSKPTREELEAQLAASNRAKLLAELKLDFIQGAMLAKQIDDLNQQFKTFSANYKVKFNALCTLNKIPIDKCEFNGSELVVKKDSNTSKGKEDIKKDTKGNEVSKPATEGK